MTPQQGDTVRVLKSRWKGWDGWTGEVVDAWKSGSVAVRFEVGTGGRQITRTFEAHEVEVIR